MTRKLARGPVVGARIAALLSALGIGAFTLAALLAQDVAMAVFALVSSFALLVFLWRAREGSRSDALSPSVS